MLFTPGSGITDRIIPAISFAGGKGSGLYWLQANGFSVPPTWVLSTTAFDLFVKQAGLAADIAAIAQATTAADWNAVQHALTKVESQRRAVLTAFQEAPLPDAVQAALLKVPFAQHTHWAVRSSATVEDQVEYSYAGQFLSLLSVPSDSASLIRAIRAVWASAFKREVLSYRAQFATPWPRMAVILQPMRPISAQERSGVAFSQSPVPNLTGVLIQVVFGAGFGVVQGLGGDLYAVQGDEVKLQRNPPPHILISNVTGGEVKAPVPPHPALTSDEARQLAQRVLAMARDWGRPVNVEFVWYAQSPEPIFVQIRSDTFHAR